MLGFVKKFLGAPKIPKAKVTGKRRRPYRPQKYHDQNPGIISSSASQLFQIAYMEGDYHKAKYWAEEALRLNPDDSRAKSNLQLAEERIPNEGVS